MDPADTSEDVFFDLVDTLVHLYGVWKGRDYSVKYKQAALNMERRDILSKPPKFKDQLPDWLRVFVNAQCAQLPAPATVSGFQLPVTAQDPAQDPAHTTTGQAWLSGSSEEPI